MIKAAIAMIVYFAVQLGLMSQGLTWRETLPWSIMAWAVALFAMLALERGDS